MSELSKLFLSLLEKVIPEKYYGKLLLAMFLIGITILVNNCYHNETSSSKEIQKELREIKESLKGMNTRLQHVEAYQLKLDSTSTNTSYDILSIKVDQNTNYTKLLDVISRGFSITRQEMIRNHGEQKTYLNTRFDDFEAYIKGVTNDTTHRVILIRQKR